MTFEEALLVNDENLIEQAKKCETIDQLKELARNRNMEFSDDDLKKTFKAISSLKKGKQELDMDELQAVSGGKSKNKGGDQVVNKTEIINSNNQNVYNFH